jgi:hypothetical protein
MPDFFVNWLGNPTADFIAYLHHTLDLPWVGTIVGLTLFARICLFPLYLVRWVITLSSG